MLFSFNVLLQQFIVVSVFLTFSFSITLSWPEAFKFWGKNRIFGTFSDRYLSNNEYEDKYWYID